jgi:hypothetical protein
LQKQKSAKRYIPQGYWIAEKRKRGDGGNLLKDSLQDKGSAMDDLVASGLESKHGKDSNKR